MIKKYELDFPLVSGIVS